MLTRSSLALTVLLGLLVSGPAGAGKLFTVDYELGAGGAPTFTGDQVNDLDGSDDLPFNYTDPSLGTFDGLVRAVDLNVDRTLLAAEIAQTQILAGGGGAFSFANFDVLIVDVVLTGGSASVDEIRIAVGSDPLGLDPAYAGWFMRCDGVGPDEGCRNTVPPGSSEDPTGVSLVSGGGFFPGAARFDFSTLDAGETSVRLFVAWADTGSQTPLSKDGQTAKFMIGAQGVGQDFEVAIVPEPGTAALFGLALALFSAARIRGLRR